MEKSFKSHKRKRRTAPMTKILIKIKQIRRKIRKWCSQVHRSCQRKVFRKILKIRIIKRESNNTLLSSDISTSISPLQSNAGQSTIPRWALRTRTRILKEIAQDS